MILNIKKTFVFLCTLSIVLTACGGESESPTGVYTLPDFDSAEFANGKPNVVATTSIIGDVVGNIGGDSISLTTLMGVGEDAHNYEATPSDLVALEQADVIFVNGWGLEEQLDSVIEQNHPDKMVVISAGIDPHALEQEHDAHDEEDGHDNEEDHDDEEDHDEHEGEDAHDEHDHGSEDPHAWWAIPNVEVWAENVAQVLGQIDPNNADVYAQSLADYQRELSDLSAEVDALLADLPPEKRKLVTNHDSFSYFADSYEFEVVGSVIPSFSTSAEPSASDLARLVGAMEAEGVCTLFAEVAQNVRLAETVSAELKTCDTVQLLSLYTDSVGEGEAGSYIGMYRSNVETIVNGLR